MNDSLGLSTELPAVSVVIPAYGAAQDLKRCLNSLATHAPAECAVSVVDDATPDDSVRDVCASVRPALPRLHYYRNEQNRGFVSTCNFASRHLRKPGTDLLLLNADTEVTAGFLSEMQAVLYLHHRHGVVTPRSNNATIFSVPWSGDVLPAAESHRVWKRIRRLLPRHHVVPTAVGFCMLIKAEVLDQFGLFDEIYSPGYNEENDFVCRINRGGYSAVAANHAYVFHNEGSSFGSRRRDLEAVHSQTLLDRYPEYERKVANYYNFFVDPVDIFASLYAPHRQRILFDFFDWPAPSREAPHFVLNLFRQVRRLAGDEMELYAGFRESQAYFADELAEERVYQAPPESQMIFDLVFRPSQIFTWGQFRRMNLLAPRLSYVSLGVAGVRSDYLNSAERQILFRTAAELSDCVFAIGNFARTDFEAFYGIRLPMRTLHQDVVCGEGSPELQYEGQGEEKIADAAELCLAAFREILAKDLDIAKLQTRWATLRMLESKCTLAD
jgi:GT2 family glycosyltransferase